MHSPRRLAGELQLPAVLHASARLRLRDRAATGGGVDSELHWHRPAAANLSHSWCSGGVPVRMVLLQEHGGRADFEHNSKSGGDLLLVRRRRVDSRPADAVWARRGGRDARCGAGGGNGPLGARLEDELGAEPLAAQEEKRLLGSVVLK